MSAKRIEFSILLAVFLDLLGFGMVIADFQLRAERFVPPGWPIGLIIGSILGSTFILQLLVAPRWGRLSDERGRKPILVACTLLSAAAMLVYGAANSLGFLLLSRILAGLGSANVAVAQAFISDEVEERTQALGRVSAAISAGLVLGPPLGGELARIGGNALLGTTAGICSLIGALFLFVSLPNPTPREAREPGKRAAIDLRLLQDVPKLRPLILIVSIAWFSLATLEGTFARLIFKLFRLDQAIFGRLFGYESLLGVIVSAYLLGRIVKRISETPLLRLAYVAQGLGLGLNPLAGAFAPWLSPVAVLFGASTLFALGSGLANPTVNALCSHLAPDDRQGELFGLLQGTRAIGFVLGPMIGGWMFDIHPAAPYYLAGFVCLLAAFLVPRIGPLLPTSSEPDPLPAA